MVLSVNVMHPPPSYCIRLDGADSTRETEGHRLELRNVIDAPADQTDTSADQPGADCAFCYQFIYDARGTILVLHVLIRECLVL